MSNQLCEMKKKRIRKGQKLISFEEEEIETKRTAKKISGVEKILVFNKEENAWVFEFGKKRNETFSCSEHHEDSTHGPQNNKNPKKTTKKCKLEKKENVDVMSGPDTPCKDSVDTETQSIRARKRKRYADLLNEKKLKTELELQQKALNYLSQWKHNKSEWKFVKLRQIWLQQNMYIVEKVPSEFWNILVEYMSSSKGRIRKVILDEAISIIDNAQNDEENNDRVQRARDIVQYLQE